MRTLILASVFLLLQFRPAILLAQEPLEFTASVKKPQAVSPKEKAFYKQALEAMSAIGDAKNVDRVKKGVSKLNDLLKLHPGYSDGYLLRALARLQLRADVDYQQALPAYIGETKSCIIG